MKNSTPGFFYTMRQRKNLTLGFIALLAVILLIVVFPVLNPILGALVFYALFRPFFLYLHRKKNWGAALSASIVIVVSFLIIVLPLMGLGWMIFNKLVAFQKDPAAFNNIVDRVTSLVGSGLDKKELFKNGLHDISTWAVGLLSFFVNGAVKVFIGLLILYFMLFFMLRSYQEFEAGVIHYLPFKHEQSLRFGREFKNVTYSNILGQGIIGVCQGIIVAVGFLIFGIPDALFWGVVSVFICFLPVVGAPIVIVPAAIIEMATGHMGAGFGILAWGMVLITILDNFMRQFIARKIADVHPLITIIGVITGIPVFGLAGIVIGPLLISYFILLVKTYEANFTESGVKAVAPGEKQD